MTAAVPTTTSVDTWGTSLPEVAPVAPAPPASAAVFANPRPSTFVIVERELVRVSRRWQTFGQRGLFAGVLMLFVAVFWAEQVSREVSWRTVELNQAGRSIFMAYKWLQFILLAVLTPVVVAQAIVEEKVAGTLELLATTRLTPRRILFGKLLSRVLVLQTLILAGLPVLALCLSLGGVEPVQVLNSALQANVAVIALASTAAFLALYSNGPMVPAVLTWIWGFFFLIYGAFPMYRFMGYREEAMAAVSPVLALAEGDGPEIFGPTIAWSIIAMATIVLAGRTWAAMAGGGDAADEDLSADLWAVEGLKKKVAGLFALLALTVVPMVIFWMMTQRSRLLPLELFGVAMWGWNVALLLACTLTYLLVCRAGFRFAAKRKQRPTSWKNMVEAWSEGRSAPRRIRQVWWNPVIWREVVTTAHGSLTRYLASVYVVLTGVLALLATLTEDTVRRESEFFVFLAFAGFFATAAAVVLMTTSSIAGEKRRNTLELLRVSGLPPWRILGGKLAATAVLLAPLALLSAAVLIPGLGAYARDWRYDWYDATTRPEHLVVRWAMTCVWGFAALTFLATSCQALALRARTPGRAWVSTLLWSSALLVVPMIAWILSERRARELADVLEFLNPGLSENFWHEAAVHAPQILASASVWIGLALLILILSARRLRATAVR